MMDSTSLNSATHLSSTAGDLQPSATAYPGKLSGKAAHLRPWLILGIILAIGGWLRLQGLGAKSLWMDEALSWRLLDFSPLAMIERSGDPHTTHPPLYFVLLRLWSGALGGSELALRSLAATAGLAAIVGVYSLARELTKFAPALSGDPDAPRAWAYAPALAAALMATSPAQIHAAMQVRGYSLGVALVAWSSLALLRALRTEFRIRWGWWALYATAALAACYTHHVILLTVAAQGTFAFFFLAFRPSELVPNAPRIGFLRSCRFRQATLAFAAIAIGYFPWLPRLIGQSKEVQGSWEMPLTLGKAAYEIALTIFSTYNDRPSLDSTESVFFAAAIACGLAFLWYRSGWAGLYLLLTGLIPIIFLIAFSLFSIRSIVHSRYLIFAQTSWLIGLAFLIGLAPGRAMRPAMAGLVLLWNGYFCAASWGTIGPSSNPGIRGAVEYILKKRAPGEPVIARTPVVFFGSLYYSRGQVRPRLCVPVTERARYFGSAHTKDEDMIVPDELLAGNPPGIWFISSPSYTPKAVFKFSLPEGWELADTERFEQDYSWEQPVRVEHYVNRSGLVGR